MTGKRLHKQQLASMARAQARSFAILFCLALSGCGLLGLPSKSASGAVVQRVPSPTGDLDALVTRSSDGGATVSTTFRIYLERKSDGLKYQILQADKVYHPIVLKWQDKNHLSIGIPCGQIFSYQNFFDLMKSGDLVYEVSVALQNSGLCSVYLSKQQGSSSSDIAR